MQQIILTAARPCKSNKKYLKSTEYVVDFTKDSLVEFKLQIVERKKKNTAYFELRRGKINAVQIIAGCMYIVYYSRFCHNF